GDAPYGGAAGAVRDWRVGRAERAQAGGVEEVWRDPGMGFGKTIDDELALLGNLGVLVDTGLPVVVGTSRKSFLGRLTGGAPAEDRLEASVATATWAMAQGAGMVRVHDVRPTAQAARVVAG